MSGALRSWMAPVCVGICLSAASCCFLDADCLHVTALYASGERSLADGWLYDVKDQRLSSGVAVHSVSLRCIVSIVRIRQLP